MLVSVLSTGHRLGRLGENRSKKKALPAVVQCSSEPQDIARVRGLSVQSYQQGNGFSTTRANAQTAGTTVTRPGNI